MITRCHRAVSSKTGVMPPDGFIRRHDSEYCHVLLMSKLIIAPAAAGVNSLHVPAQQCCPLTSLEQGSRRAAAAATARNAHRLIIGRTIMLSACSGDSCQNKPNAQSRNEQQL